VHHVLWIAAASNERDDGRPVHFPLYSPKHTSRPVAKHKSRPNYDGRKIPCCNLDRHLGLSIKGTRLGKGTYGRNKCDPTHTSSPSLFEQTKRTLHIHPFNVVCTNLRKIPRGMNERGHGMAPQLLGYGMLTA
jgi:hypothetical protein